MQIEHIAIWTNDIERLKDFYVDYFGGIAGNKYVNPAKNFESYFIQFESGTRLELMHMPSIPRNLNDAVNQYTGLIHMAVSTGSIETVNRVTEEIRSAGFPVVSEPRFTGDGYFESCVLDPDGNRIEITI